MKNLYIIIELSNEIIPPRDFVNTIAENIIRQSMIFNIKFCFGLIANNSSTGTIYDAIIFDAPIGIDIADLYPKLKKSTSTLLKVKKT
ncbi:MAG: hypothetical protein RSB34_07535 [Muribaculaceae bacterium]